MIGALTREYTHIKIIFMPILKKKVKMDIFYFCTIWLIFIHVMFLSSGGSILEYILASPFFSMFNTHIYVKYVSNVLQQSIPSGKIMKYGEMLRQDMEVFYPHDEYFTSHEKLPVLLYFHGGAFIIGGRELGKGVAYWAAQNGMIGISVGYALGNDYRWNGTQTAVHDALHAIEYVHKNAESLKVDEKQMVLMGDSAGGAIAIMASNLLSKTTKIAATVCSWPMTTFNTRYYIPLKKWGRWHETSVESLNHNPTILIHSSCENPQRNLQNVLSDIGLFGRRAGGLMSSRSLYDADKFIIKRGSSLPPTLLLCAEHDKITPYCQQKMFAEVMNNFDKRKKNTIHLISFEKAGHGEGAIYSREGRHRVFEFLKRHVDLGSYNDDSGSYLDAQSKALGVHTTLNHRIRYNSNFLPYKTFIKPVKPLKPIVRPVMLSRKLNAFKPNIKLMK